jgi:hypothetical protein
MAKYTLNSGFLYTIVNAKNKSSKICKIRFSRKDPGVKSSGFINGFRIGEKIISTRQVYSLMKLVLILNRL